MGSAEAQVGTGILPWFGAQGRYPMQHIFVFSAWIKKENRSLLQQMPFSSW